MKFTFQRKAATNDSLQDQIDIEIFFEVFGGFMLVERKQINVLFVVDIGDFVGFKPVGIMCLSSVLKEKGCAVSVIDRSDRKFEAKISQYFPDILAYSICSGSENIALDINKRLKKLLSNKVISIFGGPHPTYFPEFINNEGVDIICRGEGEEAFAELIERIQDGKQYDDIDNLWVKKRNKIIKNKCRPLKENLDELPIPDRALFSEIPESMSFIEIVLTSRGCPYECSYCFNHKFKSLYGLKKNKIRRRSVDSVIAELKQVKLFNNKVQFIQFEDDIFSFHKEWLCEFKTKYQKYVRLPFQVNLRPNVVKDENIGMLKEAGCRQITIAVESGNEFVRNKIFKRKMSERTILDAAKIIKDHGLFLITQNIIGNPIENSYADACDTIALNIKTKTDFAWVSLLNPYYGTEIWDYCSKNGYLDEKLKYPTTYHLGSPLCLNEKKKILNIYELFSLMVRFPLFFRFNDYLTDLPLRKLYSVIRKLWKGFKYFQRYSINLSSKEFIDISLQFLLKKGG